MSQITIFDTFEPWEIFVLRMGNNMVLVNEKVDRREEYKKYAFTEGIKDLGQTKI